MIEIPSLQSIEECIPNVVQPFVKGILLANSAAEGFSNSTSDIDVLLLTSEQYQKTESWHQVNYNGRRLDFHAIRIDFLRDCTADFLSSPVDPKSIKALHRIFSAKVLQGEDIWRSVIEIASKEKFNLSVALYYFNFLHAMIEDFEGAIKSEDRDSSVIIANRLLSTALDSFLAVKGKTNPRTKWKAKSFRSLGSQYTCIFERYMEICFKNFPDQDELINYSESVTSFIRDIQLLIVLEIHSIDIGCFADSNASVATSSLYQQPTFSCVKALDGAAKNFGLFGSGTPKKLQWEDVIVWLSARGQRAFFGLDSLETADLLPKDISRTMMDASVNTIFDRLVSSRALVACQT